MIYDDHQLSRLESVMLDTYLREMQIEVNDPGRLEAVYGSHFSDAGLELKLNTICATAAQLLDAPCSSVTVVSDIDTKTIATYGDRGLKMVRLEESYCQHVVGTRRPVNIAEATEHALVCELRATTEHGIRSYLGVPLLSPAGFVLGALCVWDYTPRIWTEIHVTMLASLAAVVMRFEHEFQAA